MGFCSIKRRQGVSLGKKAYLRGNEIQGRISVSAQGFSDKPSNTRSPRRGRKAFKSQLQASPPACDQSIPLTSGAGFLGAFHQTQTPHLQRQGAQPTPRRCLVPVVSGSRKAGGRVAVPPALEDTREGTALSSASRKVIPQGRLLPRGQPQQEGPSCCTSSKAAGRASTQPKRQILRKTDRDSLGRQ